MKNRIDFILETFHVSGEELLAFVNNVDNNVKHPWIYCCAAVALYEAGYITSVEYEAIIYKIRGC